MSILFFILASLCKETAALYTPFLILFLLWQNKGKLKIKTYYQLGIIVMLTLGFWLMYKIGLDHVTSLDNYKINWDMRLLLNNSMWYGLWGIGFPNFMSDYFRSIFSKPLPAFWDILKNHDIQMYFYQLLTYWSLFTGFLIAYIFFNRKSFKTYLLLSIFSLVGFLIFLGPILFFHHKWMVRLTLPLIFISLFQAYFIVDLLKNNLMTKIMAIILVIMYASWNYFGIKTHEYSSLYMMENDIYMRSSEYFLIHKNEIKNKSYIYFKDNDQNKNDIFKNSQKLKLSFHSQSFLDHFFSGKKITALYSFESPTIPPNAFIVNTYSLFSY